jgi:cell division GTPase FtsZ
VLAGDDLRLSEINMIVCGLTAAFGMDANIELGTVNDEDTFSGRLAVVVLVFEQSATAARPAPVAATRKLTGEHAALAGNGRFQRSEKTMWNDEDLDIPTYLRRSLSLDR